MQTCESKYEVMARHGSCLGFYFLIYKMIVSLDTWSFSQVHMLMVPKEPVSIFSDKYTYFGKKKDEVKANR